MANRNSDIMSLMPFAVSDTQRQAIEALSKHGTLCKAAKALGVHHSSLRDRLRKIRTRAAIRGFAPDCDMTKTVPEPFIVKGVSTLYNEDGKPINQWVKSSVEHDKLIAMVREAVSELAADVKPIKPIKRESRSIDSDLLTLYTLSDAHIGMLAWHEDGGNDWDVTIAERTITGAIESLVESSPKSAVGFFAQLGDGLHSDGMIPVTPAHGHVLDSDSRFPKIVRAATRIFRNAINEMLKKHEKVVVLMAQGNHDPASSVWLQELFSLLYENNPRVEVIRSSKPYYAITHGDVMLGFHHGHKATPERLPDVFMGEFRDMYGRTKQTYIHCGHRHSVKVIECNSAIVEQHRTIAARDAYASHGGYKSGRSMNAVTYHKTRLKQSEVVYNVRLDNA